MVVVVVVDSVVVVVKIKQLIYTRRIENTILTHLKSCLNINLTTSLRTIRTPSYETRLLECTVFRQISLLYVPLDFSTPIQTDRKIKVNRQTSL